MSESREITPVQRLALASAGGRRERAALVFALDNECARIVRMANEPLMAQIRLAWWRDGLSAAQAGPEHRSDLMDALRGMDRFADMRDALVAVIDGWEELLVAEAEGWQAMLPGYAQGRGGGLFAALAGDDAAAPGRIWALWDLAGNVSDAALARDAVVQAQMLLSDAARYDLHRLPRIMRMLAIPAIRDIERGKGAPARLDARLYFRLLRIQLLGR